MRVKGRAERSEFRRTEREVGRGGEVEREGSGKTGGGKREKWGRGPKKGEEGGRREGGGGRGKRGREVEGARGKGGRVPQRELGGEAADTRKVAWLKSRIGAEAWVKAGSHLGISSFIMVILDKFTTSRATDCSMQELPLGPTQALE